jgi:hypothetical protein
MSTAELKQLIESIAISQRETDRIVKETSLSIKDTDRQMKETDRKLKELGKQIGGLGNKFGSFAEGLASSSIERILRADFGMEAITLRFAVEKGGEGEEYDVLAYSNGETQKGMIVEVKSSLDLATIKQMKRKMDHLFRWMPEHRDKEFQGMVAYVEGSAAARQAVLAHGWHLVHVGEDLFDLKNPPGFVPKIYRADAGHVA